MVRADDWHSLAQRFTVAIDRELVTYELRELSFEVVELAKGSKLYSMPMHPYTQALLSAVPIPDPKIEQQRRRIILEGDVPSPLNPPPGCHFHTRCPIAIDKCKTEEPPFTDYGDGHFVACWRASISSASSGVSASVM